MTKQEINEIRAGIKRWHSRADQAQAYGLALKKLGIDLSEIHDLKDAKSKIDRRLSEEWEKCNQEERRVYLEINGLKKESRVSNEFENLPGTITGISKTFYITIKFDNGRYSRNNSPIGWRPIKEE